MSDASVVRAVEDASGTFATLQVERNGAWARQTRSHWVMSRKSTARMPATTSAC